MKGVLSPKPTGLVSKVCFFLVKRIIYLAMSALLALENTVGSVWSDDETNEPTYVRQLLGFLSTGDAGIAMLGDIFHHHKKLLIEKGQVNANKWLKEEVAESALRLILRREVIVHVLRSIRLLYSSRVPLLKLFAPKRNYSLVAAITTPWPIRPHHCAMLSFVMVLLCSMLILVHDAGFRSATKVDSHLESSASAEKTIFSSRPDYHIAADDAETAKREAQTSSKADKDRAKTVPNDSITQLHLPMLGAQERLFTIVKQQALPSLLRKHYRFFMLLPPGSNKGVYDVRLEDFNGKQFWASKAKSANGRSLSVTLDIDRFPENQYYISASQEKNEVPAFYPFLLKRQDR